MAKVFLKIFPGDHSSLNGLVNVHRGKTQKNYSITVLKVSLNHLNIEGIFARKHTKSLLKVYASKARLIS